ncbi:hypothetical protein AYI69_g7160, partial [Smittium culicis]
MFLKSVGRERANPFPE